MIKSILSVCCFLYFSFAGWETDFAKAQQIAKEQHRLILLNFSGSDWCAPCIRMRKEIFDSKTFSEMADTHLILVNADFPRSKKKQLDKDLKKKNELLAEKYNPDGKFPYTLLLNPDGKIIRSWDGLPADDVAHFTKQVQNLCDANK